MSGALSIAVVVGAGVLFWPNTVCQCTENAPRMIVAERAQLLESTVI